MLLTITNNNQHLRFRVSSVSHFWLIFLPNNKILQNPPKFQSASPENRPQNSGLGKNIIFRWTHSFIQKGGVKSKVWFRWSLPFLGGKISGSHVHVHFFYATYFPKFVNRLETFPCCWFSGTVSFPPDFHQPWSSLEPLQAPSRPLRPANRSLVFTGRGVLSPKKKSAVDFFLGRATSGWVF